MHDKLISIILPSYNMEEYLHRSVESLIVDKFLGEYEIIIVNDGSKDNTLEIAKDYQKQYSDTIIVIDKENGHYGSTVNAGLKIAKGKYFKVLDADDWFDKSGFEELLFKLKQNIDVDVIFTHWSIHNKKDNSLICSHKHDNKYNTIIDIDNIITDNNKYSFYSFYGIAYRTDLLKKINYYQTEGICYTDVEYSYYPMMKANTAIFYDINLYQYFIGRDGQTITEEAAKKNVLHFYKVSERMLRSFVRQESEIRQFFQEYQFLLINRSLYFSCLCLNKSRIFNSIDLKFIDNSLKEMLPKVYDELGKMSCFKIRYVKLWRKMSLGGYYLYKLRKLLSIMRLEGSK